MKKSLFAVLLFSLTSAAFANDQLMVVNKHSGFVPPQYAYGLECQIGGEYTYSDLRTGADPVPATSVVKTVYTAAVPSAEVALAFITAASKGAMVKSGGPTDGPSSAYVGILEGDVVDQHVKIYMDYSTTRYRNDAEAAVKALVEFADANCSKK